MIDNEKLYPGNYFWGTKIKFLVEQIETMFHEFLIIFNLLFIGPWTDSKYEPLRMSQVSTQSLHIWTRWCQKCGQGNGLRAVGYKIKHLSACSHQVELMEWLAGLEIF